MNRKVNLILLTLVGVLVQLSNGQTCKKCMATNDAYCADETSYYLCMNGNILTETLQTCQDDYVCTDSENICEPKVKTDGTASIAACSSACSRCPDATAVNMRYTCVSKTQYGRCTNGVVSIVSTCDVDTVCSSELYATTGKICAPKCVTDFFGAATTCNNDEITTTSTTSKPATTPNAQNLKDQCIAAQIPNKKYFYIRNANDADCKTYIYCESFDGTMEALLIRCSTGYFDSAISKCVDTKPSECNVSTQSPTAGTTLSTDPTTSGTTLSTEATTLGTTEATTIGTTDPTTLGSTESTETTITESTDATTTAATE